MPIISSVSFENEYREDGNAGKYVIELTNEELPGGKDFKNFIPRSWMDYIVPLKVENAKKSLIAAAEEIGAINSERKDASSYAIHGYAETTDVLGGIIISLVDSDNPNQEYMYSTTIWKGSTGLKLNVRLGRNDLKAYENSLPVYTVSLEKIIGEKHRIRKNIIPEINSGFDKDDLTVTEKKSIIFDLERDISDILSTTPQELAGKISDAGEIVQNKVWAD